MDYLVHPGVSEEIDNREADSLTGNIIGAAIDVRRSSNENINPSLCSLRALW